MINSTALSSNVDLDGVKKVQSKVDTNADLINEVVNGLVKEYCGTLDNYVSYIKDALNQHQLPTDEELDDFCLSLPVLLYFTGQAQESLGVKDDVSGAFEKELFNRVYSEAKGTIADKTAVAQLQTQTEFITHTAYKRAYNCIKLRVEAAYEILSSVKKVINRRVAEKGLSNTDPGRVPLANRKE